MFFLEMIKISPSGLALWMNKRVNRIVSIFSLFIWRILTVSLSLSGFISALS